MMQKSRFTANLILLFPMQISMSACKAHTCATTTSSVSTQLVHIAARQSVDPDLNPASQEPAVKASVSQHLMHAMSYNTLAPELVSEKMQSNFVTYYICIYNN